MLIIKSMTTSQATTGQRTRSVAGQVAEQLLYQ